MTPWGVAVLVRAYVRLVAADRLVMAVAWMKNDDSAEAVGCHVLRVPATREVCPGDATMAGYPDEAYAVVGDDWVRQVACVAESLAA